MNRGYVLIDALIIVIIVMTLSLMLSSIKKLELNYNNAKLSYEENERRRIEEIREINKCQEVKDLSLKII